MAIARAKARANSNPMPMTKKKLMDKANSITAFLVGRATTSSAVATTPRSQIMIRLFSHVLPSAVAEAPRRQIFLRLFRHVLP